MKRLPILLITSLGLSSQIFAEDAKVCETNSYIFKLSKELTEAAEMAQMSQAQLAEQKRKQAIANEMERVSTVKSRLQKYLAESDKAAMVMAEKVDQLEESPFVKEAIKGLPMNVLVGRVRHKNDSNWDHEGELWGQPVKVSEGELIEFISQGRDAQINIAEGVKEVKESYNGNTYTRNWSSIQDPQYLLDWKIINLKQALPNIRTSALRNAASKVLSDLEFLYEKVGTSLPSAGAIRW